MFLGHYGVALALKRAEPKLSLGTLFLAVQLVDLLWGIFLLVGWEQVRIDPGFTVVMPLQFLEYPISHSLVGMVCWALVGTAIYYSWPTRDTSRHWQAAAVVGLAIVSHFPLDMVVHAPDLPITTGQSEKIGFGLWNSLTATMVVELAALFVGVGVYVAFRSRRHPVRPGRLAGLIVVLVGIYLLSVFGPPPPSVTAIAVTDILGLLLLAAFAAWVDRRATPAELAAAGLPPR